MPNQTRKKTTPPPPAAPRPVQHYAWVHISEIKPDPSNPRINEGLPIQNLKDSFRQHGWGDPITVWKEAGTLVVGHARLKAAKQLLADDKGWTVPGAPGPGLVPVETRSFTNDAARSLLLLDNAAAERSAFDQAALKLAVERVLRLGSKGLGFQPDELARMMSLNAHAPRAAGSNLAVQEDDSDEDSFKVDPSWTPAAPTGDLAVESAGTSPASTEPAAPAPTSAEATPTPATTDPAQAPALPPQGETHVEMGNGQLTVKNAGAGPGINVFIQAPKTPGAAAPPAPAETAAPSSATPEVTSDEDAAKIAAGGRSGRHPTIAIGPHRLTVSPDPAADLHAALQAYQTDNGSLSGLGAVFVQSLRRYLAAQSPTGG